MCKKRKLTKFEAMLALATCLNSKKGKRTEKRYYKCPKCNTYHLTSR